MRLAVFIGLSFGIGVVAEDLSYKFVDTKLPFGLPSRYASRVNVLIGSLSSPKVEPLAKELANNNAFRIVDTINGTKTEEWLISANPTNPCTGNEDNCYVINSIDSLYYFAKNNVYKETNYYDEMKKIQARADFTRSIAVISLLYLILALILSLILSLDKRFGNRIIERLKSKSRHFKTLEPIQRSKFIITLLVLILIFFFASWAYFKETKEFDKRAFGYFASMLIKEKISVAKGEIGKSPTPTPLAPTPTPSPAPQ